MAKLMEPLDPAELNAVDHIWQTLDGLRGTSGDLSAGEIRAFLAIARRQGISVQELATDLGIPQSTASRYVKALGPGWRWSKDFAKGGTVNLQFGGVGLIEQHINSNEPRKHSLVLSEHGHTVVTSIVAKLHEEGIC